MGRIKKLKETDLVGGAQSTDVYPITSTLAVYDGQNKVLEDYLTHLRNTATFGGIATPTTNPGTPTSKVFYIAKEKGTYQYFGKVITEDEVIILLWDSTWRKLSTGIASEERLATKQDILTAGENITIVDNVISSTETDPVYTADKPNLALKSEIPDISGKANVSDLTAHTGNKDIHVTTSDKSKWNAKQDALTLTVKDNGNIVLANIQGQSKEFMPATPSGDPMHWAYVAAGAEYNDTGVDIVKTAPWANMVDDEADKTVIHKAGYWYLNGLGNITNEQMRRIFVDTNNILNAASSYVALLANLDIRTNIFNKTIRSHYSRGITDWSLIANQEQLEVLYLGLIDTYPPRPTNMGAMVRGCKNLFIIFCVFDCVKTTNFGAIAERTTSLKYMWLKNIKLSITLQYCSQFANCCILYMIQNEAATSAITITLHADAYARAMANADIVAALQAHPNVSLASA